ncbi:tyrosine-protein phosphatase [Cupriavidus sp. IDO]|uniref:tyrosine-protein phosphatase n=1 Tax=Cupriavidus sp. IDO TaxID=1539142 RepID=UPI0009E4235C|nr:tyrosine-protein phosphatase [Cupriavidus sp. IDO]
MRLENVQNLRDLGGLRSSDGRRVRWGRLGHSFIGQEIHSSPSSWMSQMGLLPAGTGAADLRGETTLASNPSTPYFR